MKLSSFSLPLGCAIGLQSVSCLVTMGCDKALFKGMIAIHSGTYTV